MLELHQGIARSHLWWPGLDKDLEKVAHTTSFLGVAKLPIATHIHGQFLGNMYFLVIDAHSKWVEVFQMNQTTTTRTVEILHQLFSSYELPEQVVLDNVPQFATPHYSTISLFSVPFSHVLIYLNPTYRTNVSKASSTKTST